jgi:hypothetical protein
LRSVIGYLLQCLIVVEGEAEIDNAANYDQQKEWKYHGKLDDCLTLSFSAFVHILFPPAYS